MACVTHTLIVYGSFPNSGPVSGHASDGTLNQSASDGPRPIAVGQAIFADALVPAGSGNSANGHGRVDVHAGYATLTAKACTDGVAGHSAQGAATEGTSTISASYYTVEFEHKAISFEVSGLDMFTQLRIVQVKVGEFDPRSFPDTGDPDTPLEKAKEYLTPVIPPDENVLIVQQFTMDAQGNLKVDTYGSAVDKDSIITPSDFRRNPSGTYSLLPSARGRRTLTVDRPKGEYFIRFQFTWGYGVLPPPKSC